jgi:hypothetical protein
MVNVTVNNSLGTSVLVNGVSVANNNTQVVAVMTDTFNVSASGYSTQYKIPLVCVDTSDSVCQYLSPPGSLWSFQAPLNTGNRVGGYVIGSFDYSTYTLTFTPCLISTTVSANMTKNGITVTVNDAAPSFNQAVADVNATISIVGSWGTMKLTSTVNKWDSFSSLTFASIMAACYASGTQTLTGYYDSDLYKAKQYMIVTLNMDKAVLRINVDIPANENKLGFTLESFYFPPLVEVGSRTVQGFYASISPYNAAIVPTIQVASFIPEAPFYIFTGGGFISNVVDATNKTGCLTWVAAKTGATYNTADFTNAAQFAFMTCPITNTRQLVMLEAAGLSVFTESLSQTANGYIPVTVVSKTVGSTTFVGLAPNSAVTTLSQCSGGQWGVMQQWDGANQYQFNVGLFYKNGSGTTYVLCKNATVISSVTYMTLQAITPTITNPVGFFLDSTSGASKMNLVLATLVTLKYLNNCWIGAVPLGLQTVGYVCGDITDVQSNVPSDAVAGIGVSASKQKYVLNVCAAEFEGDCMNIAGTVPDKCTGWLTHTYNVPCTTICNSTSSMSQYCDVVKSDYCKSTDERANSVDCACINLETSSYKVATRGNLSYKDWLNILVDTYGLAGETALAPECWWDTCLPGTFNSALTLSNVTLQCPESQLNVCINSLKGLNISSDSSVTGTIENDCAISSGQSSYKSTPCTDINKLLMNVEKSTNPFVTYSSYFDPTALRLFDKIVLIAMGVVTIIALVVLWIFFMKRMVKFTVDKRNSRIQRVQDRGIELTKM